MASGCPMLKPRTPEKLRELIEKFRLNSAYYKSDAFLETQVRIEFINPLLRLLGWDVDNESGHGHEYKDVIHELHSGGGKHIDYVFKVGGENKFLIEAKRPLETLEGNKGHAHQAKAYAHEAGIPLAILTDFEEMSIYQGYHAGGIEPAPLQTDDAKQRMVFFCKYVDYPRYWSFLYSLLSKKSIMLGLHDHLLARLADVKRSIAQSIYAVDDFNLLYSIAESFGGENIMVEQDQLLAAPPHISESVLVKRVESGFPRVTSGAQNHVFYLAPLFH